MELWNTNLNKPYVSSVPGSFRIFLGFCQVKTKATKQKELYDGKLGLVISELSGNHFKVELLEGDKKGEKRKYEGRFLIKVEATDSVADLENKLWRPPRWFGTYG